MNTVISVHRLDSTDNNKVLKKGPNINEFRDPQKIEKQKAKSFTQLLPLIPQTRNI